TPRSRPASSPFALAAAAVANSETFTASRADWRYHLRCMRDLLGFLLVLAAVFFIVGETRGWYLGIPTQTPILLYKKDHTAETSRRTVMRDDMPVSFSGQVRRGSVTLTVRYEQPASFQTGRAGRSAVTLFERSYRQGENIAFSEVFDAGGGVYTVQVNYQDATGLFRLNMPGGSEL